MPHRVVVPAPERFEHDATEAWRDGPRRALAELGDLDVRGVSVAAMVPSLTAVDAQGTPLTPGLLYGDERGRTGVAAGSTDDASGGFLGYVRWLHETVPTAHGFWPAQSVANHALAGEAVLDTTTASLAHPLFDFTQWDAQVAGDLGITHRPAPAPGAHRLGVRQGRRRRSRVGIGVHRRHGGAARGRRRPRR